MFPQWLECFESVLCYCPLFGESFPIYHMDVGVCMAEKNSLRSIEWEAICVTNRIDSENIFVHDYYYYHWPQWMTIYRMILFWSFKFTRMNVCDLLQRTRTVHGNRLIYASNQIWHNCNFNYQAVNFICNVSTLHQNPFHL